jgi:hypothetical protein
MADAKELPPIEERLYLDVVTSLKPPQIIGPIIYVRGLEMDIPGSDSDWSVIVVRVEDKKCEGEKCLTLFLTRQNDKVELVGMGYLPSKMAVYDSFERACETCSLVAALFFEGASKKQIGVGVGAGYAIVGNLN